MSIVVFLKYSESSISCRAIASQLRKDSFRVNSKLAPFRVSATNLSLLMVFTRIISVQISNTDMIGSPKQTSIIINRRIISLISQKSNGYFLGGKYLIPRNLKLSTSQTPSFLIHLDFDLFTIRPHLSSVKS
jgi:hypothetical protein